MHSMSTRWREHGILWPVEGCTVFACGAPSSCADEHLAWRGWLGADTRMKTVMVWGKVNREQGAEVLEQWRGRPGSYCVPAVNPRMALSKMLKEHSPQKRGPARRQCNQGDANSGDGNRRWNLQRISSGHVGTVGEHPRFWGGLMGGQRVRRYQVPPARSQGWSRQWVGCEVDTWGQEHQTAGVPIFQMLVTTIINFVNDGNIDGIIA